jgi:hypothetical protein
MYVFISVDCNFWRKVERDLACLDNQAGSVTQVLHDG